MRSWERVLHLDIGLPVTELKDTLKNTPADDYIERCHLERINHRGKNVNVRVTICHLIGASKEKCMEAGIDGYTSKPVQMAELKRALDECARAIRAGINEDSCALVLCGLLISGD